jgi:hypothetical protein
MDDLRQRLQDKRDWLASTTGMKRANATLTLADLERILKALKYLDACEQASAALPKIEPRMLGAMEPRGTSRSQEEIAKLSAERYGPVEEPRGKLLHTCA